MVGVRRVLAAAVAGALVLALWPVRADAAGVTTHAWMALDAIDHVQDPQLRAVLEAHRDQVEGGAQFPDSGYWNDRFGTPGGGYGEEAHWQRFIDAYIDDVRADESCVDLTDPDDPCAPRIAHLMGALGHGMGDEVWDWLFEPSVPDHGETYIPEPLETFQGDGGAELQMDIAAIHDHGRPTSPDTPPYPDPEGIADAFAAVGRDDITVSGLEAGKGGMTIIRGAESVFAPLFYEDVAANMPHSVASFVSAPGGVEFSAEAIAARYENTWGALLGDRPATEVGATYPADGEVDVPTTGWERDSFLPGAAADRGGAANRITAALSYALPYVPSADDPTDLPELLPEGAMTLTEVDTGAPVPAKPGYPKAVPYGSEAGEHTIDFQPAADLLPCTVYEVAVNEALLDHGGDPVTPHTWRFRTDGCCAEAPESFDDVPADHPFVDDITWMAQQCISTGYADGTYRPAAPVSRAAMSAFLYRLADPFGFEAPDEATFADVPVDHPFFAEVEWMAAEGITTGFGDGGFHPAAPVTRQSMAAFLYRLADPSGFTAPAEPSFADVPVDHPFFAEVEWMAAEGITTGFEDGTFKPAEVVTRQAMSAFLHRLADGPGVGT